MPEPLTLQLLSSSSSSTHSTVENHLVSPGPRSSSAAVVCRQRAAVMLDSALVTQFPHVTRGVNANEAQERQLATAWRPLRLGALTVDGGQWQACLSSQRRRPIS